MVDIKRRHFFGALAGATACLSGISRGAEEAAAPAAAASTSGGDVPPPPQVPLGKTGIMMSRVGQGTGMSGGNRQSNHSRMGFEKLVALLRHSYDRGITFFDMADIYGTHIYFREALRSIPRDKVTIMTKLWWRYDGNPTKTPPEFQRMSARMALERFRHEIATDHLDIVLLHCMETPRWTEELTAYMEVLDEAKQKKIVRAVGISSHNLDALRTAAACPWVDVVLARINPRGRSMDGKVEDVVPVLKQIKENGKAIIGMKILGEGRLAAIKDECIRFAQNLGLLDAMTIGTEAPGEVDENLRLLAQYPAATVG